MSQANYSATFRAIASIQSCVIPRTGNYVIAAAGAQGGDGRAAGGKGALVQGLFYLHEGDTLNVVVGSRGKPGFNAAFAPEHLACGGGGGGGTFVWKMTPLGTTPAWPLLVAGGGGGGGNENGGDGLGRTAGLAHGSLGNNPPPGLGGITDPSRHFGGGGGTGWYHAGSRGPGPIYCRGGARWNGGEGVAYGAMQGGDGGYGGGGGGGFLGYAAGGGAGFDGGAGGGQMEYQLRRVCQSEGGTSYNAGLNQSNLPGIQVGDGHASIMHVVNLAEIESFAPSPSDAPFAFGT